jgi:uncharacterized protein (DUF1684 family)
MKNVFLIVSIVLCCVACSGKRDSVVGETEYQQKMNAEFKDASKSPLKAKDLKTFTQLDFFPVDDTYKVTATLKRTPDAKAFFMPATKEKTSKYKCYGIATFTLNGKEFSLELYQQQDLRTKGLYGNRLFLPFTDETNGFASYGGGRYIDLAIPEGNTIEIDFNKSYNPYCAYNEKYSCPIPPRVNFLKTEINAGIKAYAKH